MKKQIASLLFAVVLTLSCFALQVAPVSAQQSCPIIVSPSPVFGRDAWVTVWSQVYNPPYNFLGTVCLQARLLRDVQYGWFDGDGNYYYGEGSGWLWTKTESWWPTRQHDSIPVTFSDNLNMAGLSWGWNPYCQQWDMVHWLVRYKVEWWVQDPWPVGTWTKIGETAAVETGHNEVKGKISGIAWSGSLSGFGGVNNPGGITGLWPNGNYAALFGYQSGDSAAIIGWTNDYLGSPYMHRIEMCCYTVSGYSPMVYVYVSNDYYNWELLWSGRIWHTSPEYINLGYPASQFEFVTVVAQVPQGQYGAILYVDCLTIYPYWF